jgi:hypothetical protein
MQFKYKNLTQTQIGKLFGVSSHVVGDWLTKIGLRDMTTKKPTREAHRGGYCETAPSGQAGYHWVWDAEKTVAALRGAGHKLVDELSDELVHPPALEGPFTASNRRVVNASRETVLRAATSQQAEVVVKLLNAAHRHGTLARLVGKGDLLSAAPNYPDDESKSCAGT